jgi:hypothetical protein
MKGMDMKKGLFWALALAIIVLMVYHHAIVPAKPPGFVKLVPPDAKIELQSKDRRYTVSSGKEPTKIPEGIYNITGISLRNGGYELPDSGFFGKITPVTVKEKKTTVIDFGSPLIVKAEVGDLRKGIILIGMNISGKADEGYSPSAKKHGVQLAAPKIKILDEKGKVLDAGSFKFG